MLCSTIFVWTFCLIRLCHCAGLVLKSLWAYWKRSKYGWTGSFHSIPTNIIHELLSIFFSSIFVALFSELLSLIFPTLLIKLQRNRLYSLWYFFHEIVFLLIKLHEIVTFGTMDFFCSWDSILYCKKYQFFYNLIHSWIS